MHKPDTKRLIPPGFVLLAVFGIFLAIVFAAESTPMAEIRFNVDRDAALQGSVYAVLGVGGDPSNFTQTITFGSDNDAQSYLIRERGRETLNQRVDKDLNLASWNVRFWRELDPEQWVVSISPTTGRILAINHIRPDEATGPKLSQAEALLLAQKKLQIPLDQLTLLDQFTTQQPNRTDHTFIWQRRDLADAEAQYRYSVTIAGNDLGQISEYYWLPQSWYLEKDWQLRRGGLLNHTGWTLTYALTALIGVAWFIQARRGRLRWRWALHLFAAVAVVGVLVMLNSIPLDLAHYDVNQSLPVYWGNVLGGYIGQLVTIATTIILAGMAGEALVWEKSEGAVSLSETLTKRGLVSRPVVQALWVGGLVGIFQLGFVSAFYALGNRYFGVWSPVTPLYDDTIATPFPALYGMALGLLPAIGEELIFRLGGIMVLTRYFGRPKLAIIVTAVVWAALHATYPQHPFYIRVVELSIIGILFGFLSLRYGVLASIAAHYTYNASLYVPLFWKTNTFYLLSGIAAAALVLWLLVPSIIRQLRGIPLENDNTIRAALPPLVPDAVVPQLTWKWRRDWFLVAGLSGVVVIILLVIGLNRAPALARNGVREDLVARTEAIAQASKIDLSGLNPSVTAVADWVDLDLAYIYDQLDDQEIEAAINQGTPRAWSVRWSNWDRPEYSWLVYLDPAGQLLSYRLSLPENASAISTTLAQAQTIATNHASQFIRLNDYELTNTSTSQKPNRSDYSFVWQTKMPWIGQAYRRFEVTVAGDQVITSSPAMYTPPEYRRERDQTTLGESILSNLRSALRTIPATILPILGLIGIFRRRTELWPWVWLGVVVGIGYLIQGAGRWTFAQVSEGPRFILAISQTIANAVLNGGELALLGAGAATAWNLTKKEQQLPLEAFIRAIPHRLQDFVADRAQVLRRESVVLGILLVPWILLIRSLVNMTTAKAGFWASVQPLNAQSAMLDILLQATFDAITTSLLLIGSLSMLTWVVRGKQQIALAITCLGVALTLLPLHEPVQWLILGLSVLISIWLGRTLRWNGLALAVALWLANILPAALTLLATTPRSWQLNGAALLVLFCGFCGWYFGGWWQTQNAEN
ncbi:type II CAAX prenyl endopeptidase Rce1 family protein [Herpetosiphon giganteus]|uniref:CPBP family glutamic-type intramembrane protease n=1 Tax=Herpetosiphon giganteus TaxID=2029754 RepID=UPI001956FC37|nr:hypothetical protein [Herpetosiphon giganteus]